MQVLINNVFILFLTLALGLLTGTGSADEGKKSPVQEKTSALEAIKKEFPRSKKITCENAQYKYRVFYLDKDIYRSVQEDLSDLRIVDSTGAAAPYYIDHGVIEYLKKDVAYSTKKISQRTDPETNDTIFDFQVIPGKGAKRPRVDTMKLAVSSKLFSKQVIIYGRYADTTWQQLKRDTIYHFDSYEKKEVQTGGWDYTFYRVKIEDNLEQLVVTKLSLAGSKGALRERLTDRTSLAYEQRQEGTKTLIVIKNPDRLKIFSLDLSIEGIFKRKFRLYIEEEQRFKNSTLKPRIVQMTITEGELYSFDFKDVQVSHTEIGLYNYAMRNRKLFLSIENNNDTPLDIEAIEGRYYKDRVIFKSSPGKEYTLYFGSPSASRPVYDITSYRSYIEKEKKDLCLCQEISINEAVEDKGSEEALVSKDRLKLVFNVVIILVALLLTFFLVRQLKAKK